MCKRFNVFCGLLFFLFAVIALNRPSFAREFSPKNIYKQYSPAVVFIFASNGENNGMAGTGSIIREDGLVITNAHVIYDEKGRAPFKNILIFLKPERIVGDMERDLSRRYSAKLIYFQNDLDLALLQIEGTKDGLAKIEFANPDDINIGEDVLAIGHPEQGGLWTLTTGTISAIKANLEGVQGKDVFQTEASINKGNSGGPLIDKRGYMVGINSNIARKNSDGLAITDINFSIKSSVAKHWLEGKGYKIAYGALPLEEHETPQVIAEQKRPEPELQSESEQERPVTQKTRVVEEKFIEKEKKPEGVILTQKRPYNLDTVIKKWAAKIEAEMEGMMDEMRGKSKNGGDRDIFDDL